MSTVLEGSTAPIDPESEVRKLQELVKKLEKQNQVLRSKQGHPINRTPAPDLSVAAQAVNNARITPPQEAPVASPVDINALRSANSSNSSFRDLNVTLEDVELIDIDKSLAEEDEEKWLFDSPKKVPPEKSVSPYKWARQEFDHPSPDVQTARKSLIYKLDEVAKGPSRSPSTGTLSSPGTQSSPPSRCDDTPEINGGMPSIRKPLGTPFSSQINTRTFTRPKKRKEPEIAQPASSDGYSTGDTEDSLDGRPLPVRQSPVSRVAVVPADRVTNYSPETLKYNGVTDVKTLARMQEESLRQSLNSPIGSARKSGLRGPRAKVPSLGVNEHENSPSSHSSARSSPARYDSDGYQGMRISNNSLASASSHSSSPPDSPYGSQYLEPRQEHQKPLSAIHRGSLPNLNKSANLSFPRNSSFPRKMQESGSKTQLVRPRVHGSPVQRTASPGRTLSPLRSGIPTPRSSGIPRPGSASKLPTARKSSIPSRGRMVRNMDDSWKDGCY